MNRSLRFHFAFIVALGALSSCDNGSNSSQDENVFPTDTVTTPAGTVAAPVFSPSGGTYPSSQPVTITSATSGATIYYTSDGSAPSTSSTEYTSAITVSASKTLMAIAVKSGMTTSSVGSATYTISGSSSSTIPWNSSVSYGSLTYAGQTYKTVKIGTQTWMAENLNVAVDSSWCYENSADSCAKYGRLYQWAAAMGLDASYNDKTWGGTLPRQGICPSGWHVPSDTEWSTLASYVGGASTAGAKLKSTSGWNPYDGIIRTGTDTYGFRTLPAGFRNLDGTVGDVGNYSTFWRASEAGAVFLAGNRYLLSDYDVLGSGSYDKKVGCSVRCLEDAP